MNAAAKALLVCIGMVYLAGCHHHPARVEDYSSILAKRTPAAHGTYRVRSGDTLYAIAFRYGLDHRTVARWNDIASPYTIYPGQTLRLSAPTSQTNRHAGKLPTVQRSKSKKSSGKSTSTTAGKRTSTSRAKPSQARGQRTPARKDSPGGASSVLATDPKIWLWPSKGRVIRAFVAGNPARNGLDIAGRQGQPVMATAAGKVVYSGSGLIGYGELIIIKHSERLLSAYAHNRVRLVNQGEWVKAGQKIAEMGRNDENEQVLHFEIRVRGKPVNPFGYLPKK